MAKITVEDVKAKMEGKLELFRKDRLLDKPTTLKSFAKLLDRSLDHQKSSTMRSNSRKVRQTLARLYSIGGSDLLLLLIVSTPINTLHRLTVLEHQNLCNILASFWNDNLKTSCPQYLSYAAHCFFDAQKKQNLLQWQKEFLIVQNDKSCDTNTTETGFAPRKQLPGANDELTSDQLAIIRALPVDVLTALQWRTDMAMKRIIDRLSFNDSEIQILKEQLPQYTSNCDRQISSLSNEGSSPNSQRTRVPPPS